MIDLSVIVCTYNPDSVLLARTIDGLSSQTLNLSQWELVFVDNASNPPLTDRLPRTLPQNSRIIVEPVAGLTPARLCGIRESIGQLLVFVDDDAVLEPRYLQQALEISKENPFLGAFGGRIQLEFLEPPAAWTRPFWPRLAQRDVTHAVWSNFDCASQTIPWGVGMCLRREVGLHYSEVIKSDVLRRGLDRCGTSLVSGGDDDIARTSHTLGLGTGLFPQLSLTHIIPPARLTEEYLVRLIEGQSYSGVIVDSLHGSQRSIPKLSPHRAWLGSLKRRLTMTRQRRLFFEARLRGEQRAVIELGALQGRSS